LRPCETPPARGCWHSCWRFQAGVKGISPFWEGIHRGDAAFIARDLPEAIAAYREAITEQPQNALGHYRIAEAQIAAAELKDADEAIASGLRFANNDPDLKAKLLFLLADLRERQKSYDAASKCWSEYENWTNEQKSAKGYAASATERKKAILTWKQLSGDALAVKARIEKRLKEADAAMRKSSK
jgi:tetratricopeptide (TPR) repeat protein